MAPLIPYARQSIAPEDVASVARVFDGDWLSTGPFVSEFEDEIESVAQAPAVAVTSGTAARHTAYAAVGVGPGDVVVTTPLTFVATASTAALLGAKIVFADVDPRTGLMSPEALSHVVTERTRVVAAVDYAGVPADYDALRAVIPDRTILLDDAAHSIGALRAGRHVGTLADVTTFSFFATKNITTAEGGAVVSEDEQVIDAARRFRNHGLVRDVNLMREPDVGPWHQEVHTFGLNYRLPDVLAALGTSQLRRLDTFLDRRAHLAARYRDALAGHEHVVLPAVPDGVRPAWHLFPIRVPATRRRSVVEFLRRRGVLVQVNYIPVYWHPVFLDLGYQRGLCPNAEAYYSSEISLPLYVDLTEKDQDVVIELLLEALA